MTNNVWIFARVRRTRRSSNNHRCKIGRTKFFWFISFPKNFSTLTTCLRWNFLHIVIIFQSKTTMHRQHFLALCHLMRKQVCIQQCAYRYFDNLKITWKCQYVSNTIIFCTFELFEIHQISVNHIWSFWLPSNLDIKLIEQ